MSTDLDVIERVIDIAASPAVEAIAAAPVTGIVPPPRADASDAEVDAWTMRTAGDAQHICSTARMGADDDDSVVDAECRVHGIGRLRVVDASVLRRVPRANTHLTVLAVAEHAATILR